MQEKGRCVCVGGGGEADLFGIRWLIGSRNRRKNLEKFLHTCT
jgi:hypothetical protein